MGMEAWGAGFRRLAPTSWAACCDEPPNSLTRALTAGWNSWLSVDFFAMCRSFEALLVIGRPAHLGCMLPRDALCFAIAISVSLLDRPRSADCGAASHNFWH